MLRIYTDGACRVSNPGLCSCAYVALEEDYSVIKAEGFFLGPELHSNNYAEYMGIIKALEASPIGVSVTLYCDSKLVVNQVNGLWKCNKSDLAPLCEYAQELISVMSHTTLEYVAGHSGVHGNELADKLCNDVLDREKVKESYASIKKILEEKKKILKGRRGLLKEGEGVVYIDEYGKSFPMPMPMPTTVAVSSYWPSATITLSSSPIKEYWSLKRDWGKRTAQQVYNDIEYKVAEDYNTMVSVIDKSSDFYGLSRRNYWGLPITEQRKLIEAELEKLQSK
jgi:ribonuclease HI